MSDYTCLNCDKKFLKKSSFDAHMLRKKPCEKKQNQSILTDENKTVKQNKSKKTLVTNKEENTELKEPFQDTQEQLDDTQEQLQYTRDQVREIHEYLIYILFQMKKMTSKIDKLEKHISTTDDTIDDDEE
jgi:hypothetical protein